MTTILVGYDDQPASRAALERAAALAAESGGQIVIVTVAETPLEPVMPATDEFLDGVPVSPELEPPADVAEALSHAQAILARHGLEADFVWASGEPAATILEAARDHGADRIVLGAHHQSALARLLGPNVPTEVERHAGCDVLLVEPGS